MLTKWQAHIVYTEHSINHTSIVIVSLRANEFFDLCGLVGNRSSWYRIYTYAVARILLGCKYEHTNRAGIFVRYTLIWLPICQIELIALELFGEGGRKRANNNKKCAPTCSTI